MRQYECLHLNADKLSFAVIGVIEAYALIVGAVREPAGEGVHIVVEVFPVVPVAVGLGGKRPRAGVVGIADEVPALLWLKLVGINVESIGLHAT